MPHLISSTNQRAEPPQPPRGASGLPPLVLVIEDHEDTRVLYRYLLESSGLRVVEAANGEQGVSIAQLTRPDLILMDTSLPHVDGLTATHRIRELRGLSDVPIIFLSGHAQPQARQAALESGGNDYLVKPVDPGEFELMVQRYLHHPAPPSVDRNINQRCQLKVT